MLCAGWSDNPLRVNPHTWRARSVNNRRLWAIWGRHAMGVPPAPKGRWNSKMVQLVHRISFQVSKLPVPNHLHTYLVVHMRNQLSSTSEHWDSEKTKKAVVKKNTHVLSLGSEIFQFGIRESYKTDTCPVPSCKNVLSWVRLYLLGWTIGWRSNRVKHPLVPPFGKKARTNGARSRVTIRSCSVVNTFQPEAVICFPLSHQQLCFPFASHLITSAAKTNWEYSD